MAIHIPKRPYVIEVHGPRDYTVKDVQKAFEEAAGHAVEVRPVAKDKLATFFGQFLPEASVGPFVEMTLSFLPGGILANKARLGASTDARVYRGRIDLVEAIRRMYTSGQ